MSTRKFFIGILNFSEQISIASNESRNTYSPSFQLEVETLLQEFPEIDREEEAAQVNCSVCFVYENWSPQNFTSYHTIKTLFTFY